MIAPIGSVGFLCVGRNVVRKLAFLCHTLECFALTLHTIQKLTSFGRKQPEYLVLPARACPDGQGVIDQLSDLDFVKRHSDACSAALSPFNGLSSRRWR